MLIEPAIWPTSVLCWLNYATVFDVCANLLLLYQQGCLHHGGSGGGCPPLALVVRGRTGAEKCPLQLILYIKRASIEDSASISHNTDLVNLSEIIDLHELTSEPQELPVYLNLHNRNSSAPITKVTKVSTICDVMTGASTTGDGGDVYPPQ